ncbi:hypothetical protein [Alicyclobacillus mengziensis]|uniref:Uncharacterized protein n=1 Tax=Alicyclobacillus mengziensis TaxID=2931921 RepID=A0A9X7Z934_9BACL|nr:hypothetical protein [Alicyclobacillus mengziensis]QSO49100.1 hypothetical protein JZ786_09310 [Alicyclobacillus mengziensis]
MAKHKKRQVVVEDGRDKPDFAADWFGKTEQKAEGHAESQKHGAKKDADESQPTVAQFLGNDMASRLRQMKAALEEEASRQEKKSAQGEKSSSRSAAGKGAAGKGRAALQQDPDERDKDVREDASFAELFDPAPADDEPFEQMLDKSKLDWRSFKE